MVYLFLANGFEEIEALATVDILRRSGIEVTTVGVGKKEVIGAHNITVTADILADECDYKNVSAVVLPGGMPGTTNLNACEKLCSLLKECAQKQVLLAAICAAPSVLGNLGLLKGKNYTCYPGFESEKFGGCHKNDKVVLDENGFPLITAKGPGAANEFGFSLVDYLSKSNDISLKLKSEMQF